MPQVTWRHDVDVTVEHQRRRIARAGSPSREPADEPPGLVPIDLDTGEVGPGGDLVERDLPVVDIESVVGEDPGDGRDRLVLGVSAADARDLDELAQDCEHRIDVRVDLVEHAPANVVHVANLAG